MGIILGLFVNCGLFSANDAFVLSPSPKIPPESRLVRNATLNFHSPTTSGEMHPTLHGLAESLEGTHETSYPKFCRVCASAPPRHCSLRRKGVVG